MKSQRLYRIWTTISIIVLCFLMSNNVFAQSTGWATETITDTIFNVLWAGLNLLYLITLPVLVIAGKAMDNSMIYGEFINLDKPLYMLWNLSRTFANFAIGWVILRKVIQYIFNFSEKNSPAFLKGLIFKWVGIIVWINISRFAIGALIDLSTIVTYSLWAMPLSILKETNSKDMPILAVWSYFDYQSEESKTAQWITNYIEPHTYYQRWNIYIPRCNEKWSLTNGLIIWPEYFPTIPNKSSINFNSFGNGQQYCALNTQTLANITVLEERKKTNLKATDGTIVTENTDKNDLMVEIINHLKSSTGDCSDFSTTAYINIPSQNQWTIKPLTITKDKLNELSNALIIGDGQIESKKYCNNTIVITRNAYAENSRSTWFISWQEPYASQQWLTMNTLINKSKWMVWPFITLYMSLLDFSNLSSQDTENQTAATTLNGVTEFLLKSAVSIALFIPLVALAITLIVRIVILRWVIAFIPLGIVLYGLKDEIKIGSNGMKTPSWLWWEEINGWNILWLIFAPVLPVFAISISIIILQTLQIAMKPSIESNNKTRDFLWIVVSPDPSNENTSCMNFWWLQTTCLDKGTEISGWSGFANFLPRLFLNIFAIWLMWMMVKVALSGSKITSKLWWNIMELWKTALWSIPLISIWGKWVWASALSKIPDKLYNTADRSIDQYIRSQDKTLSERLWLEEPQAKNNNKEWSFTITKPQEVQKQIEDKLIKNINSTAKTQNVNFKKDILPQVQQAIKQWENETTSKTFWALNNTEQSRFVTEQINKLMEEEKKLKEIINKLGSQTDEATKKRSDNLSTLIKQASFPTIEHGYADFVKNGKIDKMNDFITYINNPSIIEILKATNTENKTNQEIILEQFKTQIKFKDWKFDPITQQ